MTRKPFQYPANCDWPDKCPTCPRLSQCREEVKSQTAPCADLENCQDCPHALADGCHWPTKGD